MNLLFIWVIWLVCVCFSISMFLVWKVVVMVLLMVGFFWKNKVLCVRIVIWLLSWVKVCVSFNVIIDELIMVRCVGMVLLISVLVEVQQGDFFRFGIGGMVGLVLVVIRQWLNVILCLLFLFKWMIRFWLFLKCVLLCKMVMVGLLFRMFLYLVCCSLLIWVCCWVSSLLWLIVGIVVVILLLNGFFWCRWVIWVVWIMILDGIQLILMQVLLMVLCLISVIVVFCLMVFSVVVIVVLLLLMMVICKLVFLSVLWIFGLFLKLLIWIEF